jgi:undecaprenyl-diphosphatase
VLYYVAAEREWRRRLFFFLELLLSLIVSRGIVTEAIRFFFPHPRPFDALDITALVGESGDSFPSGHGAFFFALAGTVWFYNRRRGALLFFLALVIGIARVAAGVHWPLDIVGGIATGILSALIVHFLFRRDFKKLFSASR